VKAEPNGKRRAAGLVCSQSAPRTQAGDRWRTVCRLTIDGSPEQRHTHSPLFLQEATMTTFNVVRFRVKPGQEAAFVDTHRTMESHLPGLRQFSLVKTGERSFCVIGEWDDMSALVNARAAMIGNLDRLRPLLEDLGNGLGVTDPVSGEAVLQLRP
jgi:quinol monooxygenase YgiN